MHVPRAGTPDGVLHGYGSFFTFTNCTFTGNQGRQTGVMEIDGGDATFDGCSFMNNVGLQVKFFNPHSLVCAAVWIPCCQKHLADTSLVITSAAVGAGQRAR